MSTFEVIRGVQPRAWKMLVYGQPGCGKSTLASFAPNPIFLDLESGLDRVDCAKTPKKLESLDEVVDWLRWACTSEFKTIVIDTIDELEKFLAAKVIADWNRTVKTKASTVSDIPYGRGGDLLVSEWRSLIEIFDKVQAKDKNVLLVGHEQVVKFENPTDANFDFYTVNVHKKVSPIVTAKLDAVLFARYETFVSGAKDGKGKATATGNRILHTQQGASWIAKNRFNLEPVEPMDGKIFQKIS